MSLFYSTWFYFFIFLTQQSLLPPHARCKCTPVAVSYSFCEREHEETLNISSSNVGLFTFIIHEKKKNLF